MSEASEQSAQLSRDTQQGGEDAILREALAICKAREEVAVKAWNRVGKFENGPSYEAVMKWVKATYSLEEVLEIE